MARGSKVKARGGSGGRGGRGQPKSSGIEKYGYDDADVALKLHEDKVISDDEAEEDDWGAMEEDVMAFDEDETPAKQKKGKRRPAVHVEDDDDEEDDGAEPAVSSSAPDRQSASSGWRGRDFYGGDDAGDDSDEASEEELVMEEARKLEELRASRLAGHEDLLGSLMADAQPEGATATTSASDAAGAASGGVAQFESVFSAEAEKSTVPRDLSQLSEGKKRGLMKKEAPELMPLLEDFKAKLAHLKELAPLLSPLALKRVPPSGKYYLETKASLLMSTLANLSYYLLLRAEGADVRAHPVVSQLVWLRELHTKTSTLDERLGPQLRKAVKAARKVKDVDPEAVAAAAARAAAAPVPAKAAEPAPKPKLTLRERLEKLRRSLPSTGTDKASAAEAPRRSAPATKDLLKMPAKKKASRDSADAALDLEEADPTLGHRRLGAPLGEQLSAMQDLFRERAAKDKVVSADQDVEARRRKPRERGAELPEPAAKGKGKGGLEMLDEDDPLEDEMIAKARNAAKGKKEQKSQKQIAKEAARLERQYHPEEVVEGRRKTSKRILDNRGLVRQRKAKSGNARVVNRGKYDKMVKRRKGAVQEMREGSADGAHYEGEATGVRTHVKKSLKLG